tara:strand:- start:288 stop:812 length:525 start_codon:yes stop_codon:yes gene_type:complete
MFQFFSKFSAYAIIFLILANCGGLSKTDTRTVPINAQERAKKNVEEGRGVSIGGLIKNRGNTNFEFSSSNPMWRASLEIMDFLPLSTVDYSGGVIITDWYSDSKITNEALKISIRFLSNEIRSDSLKIVVHKKVCSSNNNCSTSLLKNSKINEELRSSILKKAALFKIKDKEKK